MGRGKARAPGKKGVVRGMHRTIRRDAVEDLEAPGGRPHDPDKPPEILLRKLTLAEALDRLETQLRAWAGQGAEQVLVVHGKGTGSAGGVSVLGPAVRTWCDEHPALVASWSEAPARWGGAGAIVARLR